MARQKSENLIVPKDRRKSVPTRRVELAGGGKGVPVEEVDRQLRLPFATAEDLRPERRAKTRKGPDRSGLRKALAPKAGGKTQPGGPASLEFAERGLFSLLEAFRSLWATQPAPVQLGLPWDTARSQTGRRRGSQPVVPRSRM